MNRKLITGFAVAVGALLLGWFVASPWLAAKALGDAAERGDVQAMERLVDFPRFRDSMKQEFNARFVEEMRASSGGDPLAGLGALLGPALISGAVDALVTPQAIAMMVRTGEAPEADEVTRAEPEKDQPEPKRTLGYRDLNTFAIGFQDAERQDRAITLLMKRRGLFGWKLEAVDLPERAAPAGR
ncbi:MAG TPA: DUF2939 domain-containing protein [Brevundimonas sp.]|uniref:DUF2939 domain-containing protein n=1 Tax=Brevundimonas sp. TaxID=1871086 RepID=UPI002DF38D90|nr:DUF2939 domain-containing protein [Brevundimonas sp.]